MGDTLALLQTWVWTRFPLGVLDLCQSLRGDGFQVDLVDGRKMLIVSGPAAVEALFKLAPEAGNDELRPFLGDRSLFMLKGEAHANERRAMHGLLAKSSGHADFGNDLLDVLAAADPGAGALDIVRLSRVAALRSMARLCFGDCAGLERLVAQCDTLFRRVTAWAMFGHTGQISDRRLAETLAGVRREIARLIDVAPRGDDAFAPLAFAAGAPAESILDEVCGILSAGAEPLSSALAWTLYFIAADPEVERRLDEEARAGEDLPGPYLEAVCKESLRLMPVVPVVDRVVTTDIDVAGRRLRPGDRAAACSYLTHRRPETFANPSRFAPERFIEGRFSPFEYYPFGGGARRCMGASLIGRLLPQGVAAFRSRYRLAAGRRPPSTMNGIVVAPKTRFRVRRCETLEAAIAA